MAAFRILFCNDFKRLSFSSTMQLWVLCPFTVMAKTKKKTRLKLLQNKITNAPIRVGLPSDKVTVVNWEVPRLPRGNSTGYNTDGIVYQSAARSGEQAS